MVLAFEVKAYVKEGKSSEEILAAIEEDHCFVQIVDWTSPLGHKYRFFIQELNSDGDPLSEVIHPLYKKEFTSGGD